MNVKKPSNRPRRRPNKNTFTTKSGTPIKLNRSLTERIKANRDARARRRAAYLSTLPKNRFKRLLFRLHPRELARYWFSRDGAIMALKLAGIGIVVCFVLIVGVFAYFRKDLPDITDIGGRTLGGSVTYFDRTGRTILWQDYNDTKRQTIPGDKMSPNVRNATVAVEDKDFYKHGAFDVRGILRAGLNNLLNRGGGIQGGSTISQQLVKLDQQWSAQRNIGNKIKEVILAVEMEREYSKDDILTGYLNSAPYGPVSVGVEVAAQDYFGLDASRLSIAQAAMLAGIPKSPSVYSPYGPLYEPTALVTRTHYIIDLMYNQGMITKEQAAKAKSVDILRQVKPKKPSIYTGIKAPWFVLAAKDELKIRFGDKAVKRGGWKVITTVDMRLQKLAEQSVNDGMAEVRYQHGDSAAFVAIDNKTGQVVALVGGSDFNNKDYGQLNFGHSMLVSPGSTFKPYDYGAFIDNNNAGAGSVLYDAKGPLPGYPCTTGARRTGNCAIDYDLRFPGPLTLRYAMGGSRNIPAMKAMMSSVPNDTSPGRQNSIRKTLSTAEALMGGDNKYLCFNRGTNVFKASSDISYLKAQKTDCYASSAIGDGAYLHLDDHATGLSTFARMGKQLPHTYILKITDSVDKVVSEFKQPKGKQVIKEDTAYIVDDMASDPNASYLSNKFHRYKGWHFAIKTGTTNDSFDGLMASWSTKYTAVTWVGYHTRTKAMRGFMETMTGPIIRSWMRGAHDAAGPPVNWEKPKDIKTLPAFVIHNHVGVASVEPSTANDIYPSWYNPPKVGGVSQTIDLVSKKTATQCTPPLARKNQAGAGANVFSVDVFTGTSSSTQSSSAIDDIHQCNDDKPTVDLTTDGCVSAADCQITVTVMQGTYALSGGSYTASPAGTLTITINGEKVETTPIPTNAGNPWDYTFSYTPPDGTDSLTVQADAVDSVLYSGTNSATIALNNGGP